MTLSYFTLSIPADNEGFGMFSAGHFLWLAIAFIFCFFMFRIYQNSPKRKLMKLTVAGAAVFLEILRAVLLAVSGEYGLYTLPLHLCGLAVYICFLHSLKGGKRLGQFIYAFCLPGAAFALVFPDWYYYPLFNILTTIGFELHILIVCYGILEAYDGKPDIRYVWSNLMIMLCLAVPVFVFDKLTNTNYMFLNWPVEPLTLFSFLGRPGYLLGYVPVIAVTWFLMYFVIPQGKKKSKR